MLVLYVLITLNIKTGHTGVTIYQTYVIRLLIVIVKLLCAKKAQINLCSIVFFHVMLKFEV